MVYCLLPVSQVSTTASCYFLYKKGIWIHATVLILKIFAKVHLPERRHNHVDVPNNEDEFDHELFEPTHDDWDDDKEAMEGGHGLHNENLYDDDDGVIQRHAQGTTTTFINHVTNPA
jgi:hypothetical protein